MKVNASPAEIYQALMDPKKHAKITGSPASISRNVGGKFTAWDGYIFGKNLELEPGKRIVQEWTTTEWPEGYPPSRLEFVLTKKEGGTQLSMHQTNVPPEQVESYRSGWIENYWDPLKEHFSKKKP